MILLIKIYYVNLSLLYRFLALPFFPFSGIRKLKKAPRSPLSRIRSPDSADILDPSIVMPRIRRKAVAPVQNRIQDAFPLFSDALSADDPCRSGRQKNDPG